MPGDCGEWKLWGRHPLTIFEKAGGGSFGGTELSHADSLRAIVAGLLIDVLTRLGGASQVDQQPAFLFQEVKKRDGSLIGQSRFFTEVGRFSSYILFPGPTNFAGSVWGFISSIFRRSIPPASENACACLCWARRRLKRRAPIKPPAAKHNSNESPEAFTTATRTPAVVS
jgi:hypothetical protein